MNPFHRMTPNGMLSLAFGPLNDRRFSASAKFTAGAADLLRYIHASLPTLGVLQSPNHKTRSKKSRLLLVCDYAWHNSNDC